MKKVLSIAFIFILSLGLVCTRPFDIYADTIDNSNLESYSYYIEDQFSPVYDVLYGTNTYAHITKHTRYIHIEGILDEEYVGYARIKFVFSTQKYELNNGSYSYATHQYTLYQYTYINGNHFEVDYDHTTENNADNPNYSITVSSVEIVSSDVVLKSSLNDLNSVISILNDINDYVSIDQYAELQSIVYDLSLTNDYLDILSKLRYWNFPFESFNFIYPILRSFDLFYLNNFNLYTFPIFNIPANNTFYRMYTIYNTQYNLIFLVNNNVSYANLRNSISIKDQSGNDVPISNVNSYYYGYGIADDTSYYFISIKFNTLSSISRVDLKTLNDLKIMPIFFNRSDTKVSTDFALIFGLSNQLLDDIHIIAQGTQESNDSSSNLEDINDDYDDVSQQVFGLENNFSTGFDSSMQNVPTTFNFGTQFGNKFLATATWVRNQFDTMTTNTPFGALITFSLVLGLALLIVGRRLL